METRIEKYVLPKNLEGMFYMDTNRLTIHKTKDYTIGIIYIEIEDWETISYKQVKKFHNEFDDDRRLKIVVRTKKNESDVDNYEVALRNIKRKINRQLYKLTINIVLTYQKNINNRYEETLKNLNRKLNFITDKIKNS